VFRLHLGFELTWFESVEEERNSRPSRCAGPVSPASGRSRAAQAMAISAKLGALQSETRPKRNPKIETYTPIGSAGHAGIAASSQLTFYPGHSLKSGQFRQVLRVLPPRRPNVRCGCSPFRSASPTRRAAVFSLCLHRHCPAGSVTEG
jgi:hypothetical protein